MPSRFRSENKKISFTMDNFSYYLASYYALIMSCHLSSHFEDDVLETSQSVRLLGKHTWPMASINRIDTEDIGSQYCQD